MTMHRNPCGDAQIRLLLGVSEAPGAPARGILAKASETIGAAKDGMENLSVCAPTSKSLLNMI
jgi:hypothetical protein